MERNNWKPLNPNDLKKNNDEFFFVGQYPQHPFHPIGFFIGTKWATFQPPWGNVPPRGGSGALKRCNGLLGRGSDLLGSGRPLKGSMALLENHGWNTLGADDIPFGIQRLSPLLPTPFLLGIHYLTQSTTHGLTLKPMLESTIHANGENNNFELAFHYSRLSVPTFVEDNPFGIIKSIIEDDIEYKTLFEKIYQQV